jgi:hypothetical protein
MKIQGSTNSRGNIIKVIKMLVVALILVALPFTGLIAGASGKGRLAADQDDSRGIPLPKVKVIIEKKTLEAVITNIGDRYLLSDESIITGLDGKQVRIRKMLVPCEAEITYKTENGARVAQRIKMISISSNASWHWTSDKGE